MSFTTFGTFSAISKVVAGSGGGGGGVSSIKYPIHAKAVISTNGTVSNLGTTSSGNFTQYRTGSGGTGTGYLSLNVLQSNNSYFNNKSFTLYVAYKMNSTSNFQKVLSFDSAFNNTSNFLQWGTANSGGPGYIFDYVVSNTEYGDVSSNNSNSPLSAGTLNKVDTTNIYHLFITFDASGASGQRLIYFYDNSGTLLGQTASAKTYLKATPFGTSWANFTLGHEIYSTTATYDVSIYFFNFYESILSTSNMSLLASNVGV